MTCAKHRVPLAPRVVLLFLLCESKACLGEPQHFQKPRTTIIFTVQPCDQGPTPPHPWVTNIYGDKWAANYPKVPFRYRLGRTRPLRWLQICKCALGSCDLRSKPCCGPQAFAKYVTIRRFNRRTLRGLNVRAVKPPPQLTYRRVPHQVRCPTTLTCLRPRSLSFPEIELLLNPASS